MDTRKEATNSNTSSSQDLPDNKHDRDRMQPETVMMDLPEVSDIPGQEHVEVPPLGEMADTTISSDDEEGIGVLDDFNDITDEMLQTSSTDISATERSVLDRADQDMPTEDDESLRASELDNEDFEGDPLNEGSMATDVSGDDLDEPGTEDDNADEEIGEEDEENNNYSLGGDDND